ncbi:hypothetical protein HAX54_036677 [Datura stramonium]|uniref:RING-type domain-containing protein n=1 Tax=Datura stramonium TaxID=4076 RepID=A0ABS8SGL1_DATST|nr:hypothetical protein [Datura stramonium]
MRAFNKLFSHFNQLINIFFFSLIPQALRFLILVFLVSISAYVQRHEKYKCRKIINKKSTKFVYRKRKLLGFAATEPLDCAICLSDFEHGDKGRKIESCGHIFHENCLDKWLMHGKGRQASCPLCRSVIIPENMVEVHRKVEEEGLTFGMFEEELALLLLSGLSGCSSPTCF